MHSDLLMIQTKQLLCCDMNLEETAAQIQQMCQSDKKHINNVRNAID